MNRRRFVLASAGITVSLAGAVAAWKAMLPGSARAEDFELTRTEAEWRALLTEEQYAVLREEATEYPGTSPLLGEKRPGTYHCAGCDLALYPSTTKYESGTGWPSFWDSLPGAIGTKMDRSLFMTRTEVHCRRCGGHLGHIFEDGPPPTGKRHCLNGAALTFRPTSA